MLTESESLKRWAVLYPALGMEKMSSQYGKVVILDSGFIFLKIFLFWQQWL